MPTEVTTKQSKPPKKGVTLRMMAQKMDLNVGTISRALAGEPGIAKERVQSIRCLAKQMGYRPKPLRRKRTDAIGVINVSSFPGVLNDFYAMGAILGIDQKASQVGRHVHVEFVAPDIQADWWPAFLRENRVDGVFLVGCLASEFHQRLQDERVPAVSIDTALAQARCSCVSTDFIPATSQAVRELIEMGHREIGFIATEQKFQTVEDRYQAYLGTMLSAGLEPKADWIVSGVPGSLTGGREAVQEYRRRGVMPTALVFVNDWMALGASNELTRLGYRVPEDVSLVGHDDTPICQDMSPALTTVDTRQQEVVSRAFDLLLKQIDKPFAPVAETIPARLVRRESCQPPVKT